MSLERGKSQTLAAYVCVHVDRRASRNGRVRSSPKSPHVLTLRFATVSSPTQKPSRSHVTIRDSFISHKYHHIFFFAVRRARPAATGECGQSEPHPRGLRRTQKRNPLTRRHWCRRVTHRLTVVLMRRVADLRHELVRHLHVGGASLALYLFTHLRPSLPPHAQHFTSASAVQLLALSTHSRPPGPNPVHPVLAALCILPCVLFHDPPGGHR
jgi:hypothetical protein